MNSLYKYLKDEYFFGGYGGAQDVLGPGPKFRVQGFRGLGFRV